MSETMNNNHLEWPFFVISMFSGHFRDENAFATSSLIRCNAVDFSPPLTRVNQGWMEEYGKVPDDSPWVTMSHHESPVFLWFFDPPLIPTVAFHARMPLRSLAKLDFATLMLDPGLLKNSQFGATLILKDQQISTDINSFRMEWAFRQIPRTPENERARDWFE